jgi:hypothetical protein
VTVEGAGDVRDEDAFDVEAVRTWLAAQGHPITDSSSHSPTIRGTSPNGSSSADWIRNSRPMSWAPFAFWPEGGRRRIRSCPGPAPAVRSE